MWLIKFQRSIRLVKIYLVGGAVRDELLGYPTDEYDYVVVGANPELMVEKGFTPVGKDFPVFLHPKTKEEYALARTERKSGKGYKGFTVNAAPNVTLEEDLIRRDLTINAIAKSEKGDIIDPYGGAGDIKLKRLKHVSEAFREDPVRILRVARFAARYHHLGFTIAPETLSLMKAMVEEGETNYLVSERVWKEFSRALTERSPHIFIQVLSDCGALKFVMPEIDNLQKNLKNTEAAPLTILEKAAQATQSPSLRFATMLHDLDSDKNRVPLKSNNKELKSLNTLNSRICVPNEYADLCSIVIRFSDFYKNVWHYPAEDILECIKKIDAIRKPDRFHNYILCCDLYQCATGKLNAIDSTKNRALLEDCKKAVITIEARYFLQKGFTGKQLGEAIDKRRIQLINDVITKQI